MSSLSFPFPIPTFGDAQGVNPNALPRSTAIRIAVGIAIFMGVVVAFTVVAHRRTPSSPDIESDSSRSRVSSPFSGRPLSRKGSTTLAILSARQAPHQSAIVLTASQNMLTADGSEVHQLPGLVVLPPQAHVAHPCAPISFPNQR